MKQLFVLILGFLSISLYGQENYDSVLKTLKYHKEKIDFLEKEVKLKPNSEKLLRSLAFAYLDTGLLHKGEICYQKALKINDTCANCYIHLARLYGTRGSLDSALQFCEKGIGLNSTTAWYYAVRGEIRTYRNDDKAIGDFNKAIELDPSDADLYAYRGAFYANAGASSKAFNDLSKAINLGTNDYFPYYQRALLHYKMQMHEEGLGDIDKAISLDSSKPILYNVRGAIYSMMGNHEKAIENYTYAIRLDPKDFQAYFNRALEKHKMEDMDGECLDMQASYDIVIKEQPDYYLTDHLKNQLSEFCDSSVAGYYYQRGVAFYNLGLYDKSIEFYTRGLKKFPGNTICLSFRGNTYRAMKENDKALQDYYAVLATRSRAFGDIEKSHMKNAETGMADYVKCFISSVYYNIALVKFVSGQIPEAIGYMDTTIAETPFVKGIPVEDYYNSRGFMLMWQRRYDEAIADFEKSIIINPEFDMPYVNRAVATVCKGEEYPLKNLAAGVKIQGPGINYLASMPLKMKEKKPLSLMNDALEDCTKAITINNKNSYAYYVRGHIRRMAGDKNYCEDLRKAQLLGIPLEEEMLKECR